MGGTGWKPVWMPHHVIHTVPGHLNGSVVVFVVVMIGAAMIFAGILNRG